MTRWRWDEPSVAMVWVEESSGISKSVTLSLANEDTATVELNAWKDIDDMAGHRVRRWRNQPPSLIPLAHDRLVAVLPTSLRVVRGWTEKDLTETSEISQEPVS